MSASAGAGSIAGARPDSSRGLLTQQQQQRRRQRRQHQSRQQQGEQSSLDAKDRSQLLRPHTVESQSRSQRSSHHGLSPVREKWARIKRHLQKEHSQSTLELPHKVAPSQPCTFGYRTPMFLKPGGGGEPKQYFRCALSHTQAPTLCAPLPAPLSLTRPLVPVSSLCPLSPAPALDYFAPTPHCIAACPQVILARLQLALGCPLKTSHVLRSRMLARRKRRLNGCAATAPRTTVPPWTWTARVARGRAKHCGTLLSWKTMMPVMPMTPHSQVAARSWTHTYSRIYI